ncbi:MAG: hypothetical protein U0797_18525 [Gemmataceae bacterium]
MTEPGPGNAIEIVGEPGPPMGPPVVVATWVKPKALLSSRNVAGPASVTAALSVAVDSL